MLERLNPVTLHHASSQPSVAKAQCGFCSADEIVSFSTIQLLKFKVIVIYERYLYIDIANSGGMSLLKREMIIFLPSLAATSWDEKAVSV
jgi:hypothetical protein